MNCNRCDKPIIGVGHKGDVSAEDGSGGVCWFNLDDWVCSKCMNEHYWDEGTEELYFDGTETEEDN